MRRLTVSAATDQETRNPPSRRRKNNDRRTLNALGFGPGFGVRFSTKERALKLIHSLMAAAVAAPLAAPAAAADSSGAGATFPYPIYAKWADAYKKETGIGLNYQSIGSGGGIKQISARTVDFGAPDMPLKPEELEKSGLVQFPTVIGGDVPVVNVKGIAPGQLRLTGAVLAD